MFNLDGVKNETVKSMMIKVLEMYEFQYKEEFSSWPGNRDHSAVYLTMISATNKEITYEVEPGGRWLMFCDATLAEQIIICSKYNYRSNWLLCRVQRDLGNTDAVRCGSYFTATLVDGSIVNYRRDANVAFEII